LAFLEALGATLREKGFHVLQAMTGQTAIECARSHAPDVIVLDLNLPDMPGNVTVMELRGDARTKGIPILIHTGMTMEEEERQNLAGHVQSITSKGEHDALFSELERIEASPDEKLEPTATT
jgi:CheY-like chemotaxis protein